MVGLMEIKASAIKPGMVICIKRGDFDDVYLVTTKKGFVKVEYTYLDFQDSYNGLYIGNISGDDLVNVITGKKRKYVIIKIKDAIFKRLHDTENIVNTINLIEAMGSK